MNQQDIDELTGVFVEESQEIVENLNKDVLALEKYVGNPELNRDLLNNIFRYVHTLKGNSGLAGADKLRDLAHKMESLLDKLRKEKLVLSSEIVDLLFEGIDRIGSILQEVITGRDQGISIEGIVRKLERILSGKSDREKLAKPTEKPMPETQPAEPIPVDGEEIAIPAVPDDIKRVLTEYEENRLYENIAKHARIYEVVLNLFMEGFEEIVTAAIEQITTIGEVIAKVPSSKTPPGYDLQVRIIFASSLSVKQLTDFLETLLILSEQNFSLKLLLGTKAAASPKPSSNIGQEALPVPPLQNLPPNRKELTVTPEIPQGKLKVAPQGTPQPISSEKPEVIGKTVAFREVIDQSGNTVRVDIKKLDNLMNIVGELVLAKARYLQFESELDGLAKFKALKDNLRKNNKSTSKKLEDLREAILQVRMVQIGSLFNRFPRIVRDLAKTHGKRIQLILKGEETELDKAVVDELGDPLIHLIRNAVDHGIEDRETRQSCGKAEIGTITLRAYQEGSYIVIEIQDDGAGIDVKRVWDKAIEAGLIEKNSKLSENEVLNCIFHPGFSTAKSVTDTSGRGVGMDVVKLTISRLKGIIDIRTSLNVGTKFIVKLPLTLAIIQVLLVRIENHTYAIPLSSVSESFKLHSQKIEIVNGQEVTQLRNTVLPFLRLKDAFGLYENSSDSQLHGNGGPPSPPPERSFVVVVGLAEKKIGIVVDELLEQQEIVIKPLGRYLTNTPGFAGATTLGDGRVVLILDVVGLIESLNTRNPVGNSRQEQSGVMA